MVPGDTGVGGEGEGVAGVVVEPGEDLGVLAAGEGVVGEVGLPRLVGLVGFEADVGRPGPLGRGRGDEPSAAQRPVDRRSRHDDPVVVLEVPADGVGAGIRALGRQAETELSDQRDGRLGDGRR